MIEALIAGERDPRRLAELARGRMKTKRSELIAALDGRFDDHHAELARLLLAQIDSLNVKIGTLTTRIEQLIAAMDEPDPDSHDHRGSGIAGSQAASPASTDDQPTVPGPGESTEISVGTDTATAIQYRRLTVVERLDEITGVGQRTAQTIIAEIGLDMTRFPTPEHLVSWAKLCPRIHPVSHKSRRQDRQGQSLPQGRARRGRRRGRPYQHLPRRTLPAHRQTPRQTQSPRRGRPLHPHDRLAAAFRSHRPIPRPRPRLPHQPSQYRTKVRNHLAQLTAIGSRVTLQPAAEPNPHRHNTTRLCKLCRVLSPAHSP